ncbi:hypothetical protein ACR820_05305 [Streptomyces netropsis]
MTAEVREALGGKISPAVLAMTKALLVQAGARRRHQGSRSDREGLRPPRQLLGGAAVRTDRPGPRGNVRPAEKLEFTETSEDQRVLDALAHAMRHQAARGEYITAFDEEGKAVDISFATQNWRKAVVDKARTGQFVRKHFEAMVFTALAEELRTGDVAVVGSEEYADWSRQLLDWEVVKEKLGTYLVEVGLCEEGETDGFDAVFLPPTASGQAHRGRRGGGRRVPGQRGLDHRSRDRYPVAEAAPLGRPAALDEAPGAGDQGQDAGAVPHGDRGPDRVLGWTGGNASARCPATSRNWTVPSAATSSPPSSRAPTWARTKPPGTSPATSWRTR